MMRTVPLGSLEPSELAATVLQWLASECQHPLWKVKILTRHYCYVQQNPEVFQLQDPAHVYIRTIGTRNSEHACTVHLHKIIS